MSSHQFAGHLPEDVIMSKRESEICEHYLIVSVIAYLRLGLRLQSERVRSFFLLFGSLFVLSWVREATRKTNKIFWRATLDESCFEKLQTVFHLALTDQTDSQPA